MMTQFRVLIVAVLAIASFLNVDAQGLRIVSMKQASTDLSGATSNIKSAEGQHCALVKVVTSLENVDFPDKEIVRKEIKGNEYWLYLPNGTKSLRISYLPYPEIRVNFKDYSIDGGVQSNRTYILDLTCDKVKCANGQTIDEIWAAANSGNKISQYNLGCIYKEGYMIPQNINEAMKWWEKSAIQGYVNAQFNLGYEYLENQDYEKALKWLKKAAEQDDYTACGYIGSMYMNGLGVPVNQSEGFKWTLKSANGGDIESMGNIGKMYLYGHGVDKDTSKAFYWLSQAAIQGNPEAQFNLGTMYDEGNGVSKDINKAVEWYMKSAEQGHVRAQYFIGICYQNGDGVARNYDEAEKWYKKAALQGDPDAQQAWDEIKRIKGGRK